MEMNVTTLEYETENEESILVNQSVDLTRQDTKVSGHSEIY